MRKLFLPLLFLLFLTKVNAQESQNIADLDFLYQAIQKLPSYKDQLKNNKNYTQLYENLRKSLNTTDDFEVYQKLLQLIYPIKDNHLGFYRKSDSIYKFNYIKPKIDVIKLEEKYAKYPIDSIEGTYYYNGNIKYKYVVYEKYKNIYYLQSLITNTVDAILNKTNAQNFDVILFLNPPLSYILYRSIKFSNGVLIGLPYQKQIGKNYAILKVDTGKYEYKTLTNNVGYLRLSSFSSTDENIKKATNFFNSVKSNINDKNLIVDLRNNGGGGYKNSRQFLSFLINFKGNIYILQNGYTVSNAEQFIITLKGKENVKVLGETTKGMITYGSNYGNTLALPSKRFLFYPTDMAGSKKELAFESIGIKPDITLNPFTEDWITQTLTYIKAN